LYPQTDYDGPPPNYVELELQIVPYAAAQAYHLLGGVHEVAARLLVIAFSLGTVLLLWALGRELYSARAGLIASALFAITPGAVYYGRAIIPESDMLFFSVAALLFWWRFVQARRRADFLWAAVFAALAFLAKPPALVILAPIFATGLLASPPADVPGARLRLRLDWAPLILAAIGIVPLWLYLWHLHAIAEWHWATGISGLHVLPALVGRLVNPSAFIAGVAGMLAQLKMLATTILGPALFGLVLLAAVTQPQGPQTARRNAFFGAWIVALGVYAFVVVNVERVDYYLMPLVLWAVLYAAGALDHLLELVWPQRPSAPTIAAAAVAALLAVYAGMLEVHPYYTWSRAVYAAANEVRTAIEPGTLIVMGHYDPSVLYTIGHRGWEEDPLVWSVADMQSAIRKGARYYVAVEVPRLRANRPLYGFLQRFARVPVRSGWQVYDLQRPAVNSP
jgi:4-amino-4-deoxy-L-arabinose transferase-like glycosyltransferase